MAFGVTTNSYPLSSNTGLVPTAFSKTPRAKSVADALDENGNVADRTYYGGSATIVDCSVTLVLKSGTAPTSITLGNDTSQLTDAMFVTSVQIDTGNGQWPTYTIQWKEGLTNVTGSAFAVTLPSLTPTRTAQAIGVSPVSSSGNVTKLTGSSATFSCDYNEQLDGSGNYAASAFSNGTATSSGDGVVVSGEPAWAAETGWTTEDGGAPIEETNTDYGTTSATVSKYLAAAASN